MSEILHPRRLLCEPVLLLVLVLGTCGFCGTARAIETAAEHAILVDYDTGTVLMEKAADEPMAPASMSKLMTLYMVFERVRDGSLTPDSTMAVSEKAWRMGGSKMFVRVNTRVSVDDLLRGIVIQSGNDACVVVAEGLAGSEDAFAGEMTARARDIGLTGSIFRNSTGWPDPEHVMTARDLAHLAGMIIREFPEQYALFSEKVFTYNKIRQGNRNPLLYRYKGADGLKTGHTEASGYGLTASAQINGRRLILVVNGLKSVNKRAREAERLLDWGFREFGNYDLFRSGEEVTEAKIWLGQANTVPLVIEDDLKVTMARRARRQLKVVVSYEGPIAAPVRQGQKLGLVSIKAPDTPTIEVPLVAGSDVPRLGIVGRLGAALRYLAWGAANP
ncbi:MAG: D-alanyl-D-alanine carboxypeptidase family protein [Alphaproteobacteria bacterium]|nr:D-alanyl-D-alanine carboxypeptidase family protein [Alphaproteobacteria bacterium]HJP22584.1 D-alanyl-D-alanine carboxypeptidase family protein [Alphaproteobacteria bacterium]